MFSFNWLARSRSAFDIQKRCEQLIVMFKKEAGFIEETKSKTVSKAKPLIGKRKRQDDEELEEPEKKGSKRKQK